ncbi:hypothetical protein [Actinomadura alba]|uniref:Uncharacterized protein n=1 Tax=Actinomadura alba TaxID=406431 RepID=A0ABR7LZL3_9ACTN|nr:hypothetical protein [Actinomadura alba]MBC6470296.1 hypothetical protein [Actinomadura alba]
MLAVAPGATTAFVVVTLPARLADHISIVVHGSAASSRARDRIGQRGRRLATRSMVAATISTPMSMNPVLAVDRLDLWAPGLSLSESLAIFIGLPVFSVIAVMSGRIMALPCVQGRIGRTANLGGVTHTVAERSRALPTVTTPLESVVFPGAPNRNLTVRILDATLSDQDCVKRTAEMAKTVCSARASLYRRAS